MTASEVGKIIGKTISEQSVVKENLSADSADNELNVINQEELVVDGKITITKKIYATDSFILDHPVQGELDSAVYKLDEGYEALSGLMFPVEMPVTFMAGGEIIIYEETF